MAQVDLNIDLGELPGEPAELFALATVANIACGGHAGDRASMARAVSFALTRGTRVAAHPSYPDRARFGRVTMAMAPSDLATAVEEQCAALQAVARKLGYPVTRVKPHGALYHDAAGHPVIAAAVLEGATRGLAMPAAELTVIGPPRSPLGAALLETALRLGARYAREGFADRAYRADGTLVPRSEPGALITDPGACARQALSLASAGALETICVHGDSPGAVAIAGRVRDALAQAGLLEGAS
jgi:5-oxoprolinase (ATP-hydrolysing) subunit A